MRTVFIGFLFLNLFFSCNSNEVALEYRTDFTPSEQEIIAQSKKIIEDCYFATCISVDREGQPRARIMEPFSPDPDFTIWMATNPKSRKVGQIEHNAKTTLHYFDKKTLSYVSLYGRAYIVNDSLTKANKWKDGWEKFYKNRDKAYLLIQFIPNTLEMISITRGYTGDAQTWQPHQVILRE